MWQQLKPVLVELFTSKKFLVFLASSIALGIARLGFTVDPATLVGFLTLAASFIFGQGIADAGAKKAELNAATTAAQYLANHPDPAQQSRGFAALHAIALRRRPTNSNRIEIHEVA